MSISIYWHFLLRELYSLTPSQQLSPRLLIWIYTSKRPLRIYGAQTLKPPWMKIWNLSASETALKCCCQRSLASRQGRHSSRPERMWRDRPHERPAHLARPWDGNYTTMSHPQHCYYPSSPPLLHGRRVLYCRSDDEKMRQVLSGRSQRWMRSQREVRK